MFIDILLRLLRGVFTKCSPADQQRAFNPAHSESSSATSPLSHGPGKKAVANPKEVCQVIALVPPERGARPGSNERVESLAPKDNHVFRAFARKSFVRSHLGLRKSGQIIATSRSGGVATPMIIYIYIYRSFLS